MRTAIPAWEPAEPTQPDADFRERLEHASTVLRGRRIVALTGAGISTASGIPDYRSPNAPRRTPMTLQQFLSSAEFRRRYWARNHLGWRNMDCAKPNAAHRALAALPSVSSVITQNVDLLHLKAGSRSVIDLHGNYAQVRCLSCDFRISRHGLHSILEPLNAGFTARIAGRGALEVAPDADVVVEDTTDFTMIDCPHCGGIVKPDIIYFGESVPKDRVNAAFAAVDDSDAMLVLGTSLTVMSGLRFVRHAHRDRKPIVIVNRGATRGDPIATVRVDADVVTALEHLRDTALLTADRSVPRLETI